MSYVTVAECKAESIDVGDDARLQVLINQSQTILESVLGQWFESREQTFKVNGRGSKSLFFDVPIVEISSIKDSSDVVVDSGYYSVYNRHLSGVYSPDDRLSPRIEKSQGDTGLSLYDGYSVWTAGTLNYEVSGYWGWTDYDGHDDTVLAYDAQTGDFTVGQVVTGATSGATGTIAVDDDQGTTGTLTLTGVVGHFQDDEAITDPLTGAAVANIATHWQGITPLSIKMATILLVKRLFAKIGNPIFESVLRKGANDKVGALPYSLLADREIDMLIAPYRRLPTVRSV